MSGRGLIEFFLKWRGILQINGKNPDLVIYIEHEAWDEFNLALVETLRPEIGVLVAEDVILSRNQETKLLGFKFRRAPKEPTETFDEASGSRLTEGEIFGQ